MRRFLFLLAALCLLISGAAAEPKTQLAAGGFGVGNNLTGFWGGKATKPPPSITFLQCSADDTASPFTYTAQNVGTASADRHTGIAILSEDGSSVFNVSTVTVGGDAATEIVDEGGGGSGTNTTIYLLANPVGTSEDVTVTFSEAITGASVCLFQINNLSSITPVAINSANGGAGATLTLDLNVSAFGIAIGVCGSNNTGGNPYSWTGMTERHDTASAGMGRAIADFVNDATANSPLGVTCVPTTGSQSGVSASFL